MSRYSVLVVLCLSATASAQDDSLQKLLDNIPNIEQPKAAVEEKAAEEAEPEIDLAAYTAMVRQAVLSHWEPNAKTAKKHPEYAAQFLVKIGEDGSITDVRANRLSGNKKFDQGALDAINNTPPLMAPTDSLRTTAAAGLLVTFVAPQPQ